MGTAPYLEYWQCMLGRDPEYVCQLGKCPSYATLQAARSYCIARISNDVLAIVHVVVQNEGDEAVITQVPMPLPTNQQQARWRVAKE